MSLRPVQTTDDIIVRERLTPLQNSTGRWTVFGCAEISAGIEQKAGARSKLPGHLLQGRLTLNSDTSFGVTLRNFKTNYGIYVQ